MIRARNSREAGVDDQRQHYCFTSNRVNITTVHASSTTVRASPATVSPQLDAIESFVQHKTLQRVRITFLTAPPRYPLPGVRSTSVSRMLHASIATVSRSRIFDVILARSWREALCDSALRIPVV